MIDSHISTKTVFAFLFLTTTCLAMPCVTGDTPTETQLPNVVIILADDMGYGELQCLNHNRGKTKNKMT